MSLFLKRVFPSYRDEEEPARIGVAAGLPPWLQGQGQDVMGTGILFCLPGEPEDVLESAQNRFPFVARLQPMPGPQAQMTPDDYHALLRTLLQQLLKGTQLEVLPGRFWKVARNKALSAELGAAPIDGSLLLEERLGDVHKTLPDSLYQLSRLKDHDFLADLADGLDAPPGEDSEQDNDGEDPDA